MSSVLGTGRDSKAFVSISLKTQLHAALQKTNGPFGRHTSAIAPNVVLRIGLARTGGKQAVLMRADHRFVGRFEFAFHSGHTSFRQAPVGRGAGESCRTVSRVFEMLPPQPTNARETVCVTRARSGDTSLRRAETTPNVSATAS